MDEAFFTMAREHITAFRKRWQDSTMNLLGPKLEIGPEHDAPWPGAETLGLNEGYTYQADITQRTGLPTGHYAAVIAMDVLEHVVDPFAAVQEIERILKPRVGLLLASAPWNFRIHGPIPDLWRFNQNSWKLLLRNFHIVEMDVLDTPDRPLMPLHINIAAMMSTYRRVDEVNFERIER